MLRCWDRNELGQEGVGTGRSSDRKELRQEKNGDRKEL